MTVRRAAELGALALAASVWGYVGWDGAMWDARYQLLLHVAAVAAVGGLLAVGAAGGLLPRTRLDLPMLALVAAFGLATLSAWNPGVSARALAAVVATAAMLPVALVALRHRPGWTAMVVTLPIIGLSLGALGVLGWRRIEWILAGGPGLPPVRLGHEGTPFGSVAVPPFVLMAALPIALLIPHRGWRLGVILALAAVGVPLTLLSGSRSAWLAMAVTAVVMAAPSLGRRLRLPRWRMAWTPGRAGLAVMGLVGLALAGAFVAPRVFEAGSLAYRGYLWRDTLAALGTDPILGVGPGGMPFARQVAAPALTFPVRQPHSHDVPLGILGDAGLVGLAAALILFVAFVAVAGPWRTRHLPGRAAFAVLAGFAVGSLFEDLTFLPNFNLLVVLLVAMALSDAGAVRWQPLRLVAPLRAAAAVGAVGLGVVLVVGDAAAIAYRAGVDAAGDERWPASVAWFSRSAALDPWQPTAPKSLAVAAERAGDLRLSLRAARRATELNPGDGSAWTNVALLCLGAGDTACARAAADQAVARAATGRELINAALTYEAIGDPDAADRAYRLSALSNYWTTLTFAWPRPVAIAGDEVGELGETAELNRVIARGVLGQPVEPHDYGSAYARILAFALRGEWPAAEAEVQRAIRIARGTAMTWDLAALLERHHGGDPTDELRIGRVARGLPLTVGASSAPRLTFDIATFRAYPADEMVSSAERLLPQVPWPWILLPYLPPAG